MKQKTAVILILTAFLCLLFACDSEGGGNYNPFVRIENETGYTVTGFYIDGGVNLLEGDPITYSDSREFAVEEGTHTLRLEVPGHPDLSHDYIEFDNGFPMGYYLLIEVESSIFFTDYWNVDYWDLD